MDEVQYQAYLKGVLRLDARGTWFHNGVAFSNKKVRDLFFRSIVWREDIQEYVVRIGKGDAHFDCEDTAYFVTDIDTADAPWNLYLTDGSQELLNPHTLQQGAEHQLYCTLQSGHRARFMQNCHQHILEFCEQDDAIRIGAELVQVTPVAES